MIYATPALPDELYHHGIKGQRWGIRRYQNPDGTWTEAGKKRYGSGKNRYKNEDGTYTEEGHKHYSEEGAKKHSKKVLMTAAAVVGTAAAIYAAREIGRNYFDETIKPGAVLVNLASRSNRVNEGLQWYASFRKGDNDKYAALFGLADPYNNKIKSEINVKDKLKVAGLRTAEKQFKNLMKNDPEFKDAMKNLIPDYRKEMVAINPKYKFASDYEVFIAMAPINSHSSWYKNSTKQLEKFYNRLEERGYSGVHDTNDRKYSGFKTKANIIFDNSKFKDMDQHRLSNEERKQAGYRTYARMIADTLTHPSTVAIGAGIGASSANKKYNKERAKYIRSENERKKKENNK